MDVTSRRALSVLLGVVLVAAVLGLIAIVLFPIPLTTAHTEFYVLGENGTASEYPSNLSVDETGTVIVGITNREHHDQTYHLKVKSDESTFVSRQVTVERGETWEEEVSFSFDSPGDKSVQLLLYLDSEDDVYRQLRLSVTVQTAQERMTVPPFV